MSAREAYDRATVYLLPDGVPRPRLRGRLHQGAFFVALALGVALVLLAPTGRAALAGGVYAGAVAGLFGASALYHRGRWTPGVRQWLRRLDHSMIGVLIAGTYTPLCLLVLDGPLADGLLVAVWAGALAGAAVSLLWIDAPRWVSSVVYLALGWVAVGALPALAGALGPVATALLAAGGLLYTAGAAVYARGRPDPSPLVFGYHEVFHAFTIGAAALHYAVIAFWVVPGGG